MRILRIHPFVKSEMLLPSVGGMARNSLKLTIALAKAGHEVLVLPIPEKTGQRFGWKPGGGIALAVAPTRVLPSARELPRLLQAVLRLTPRPAGWRALVDDLLALTALLQAVRIFRPEIIHNHLARVEFPRLAHALGIHGNLVLTHHHGDRSQGLTGYDRMVFPSQSSLERIVSAGDLLSENARCVYNAVSRAYTVGEVRGDDAREGIWYVGAVRRRKGIDLLLDAYRMDERLRRKPLFVIGTGEDTALLDDAIRDGLPVRPLGQLEPEEIARGLAQAEAVVIPSRLEAFSTALLEALCCGAPVVGWAPQVRELETLLGERVGLPFDGRTQTAQELVLSINKLEEEIIAGVYNRQRIAARVREQFSTERFLASYLAVYRELQNGG